MVNLKPKVHRHCTKHKHKYLSILRAIKRNKTLFTTLKCSNLTNVELLYALEEICSRFSSVVIKESTEVVNNKHFDVFEVLSKCWVVLNRIPDCYNGGVVLLKDASVNKNDAPVERGVLRAPRLKYSQRSRIICDYPTLEDINSSKLFKKYVSTMQLLPMCDITTNTKDVITSSIKNVELTSTCITCSKNETYDVTKECDTCIPLFNKCSVILNRLPDEYVATLLSDKAPEYAPNVLRECSVILHRLSYIDILNTPTNGANSTSIKINKAATIFKHNTYAEVTNLDMENDDYSCRICKHKTRFKNAFERHMYRCNENKEISSDYKMVQKFPLKSRLINF